MATKSYDYSQMGREGALRLCHAMTRNPGRAFAHRWTGKYGIPEPTQHVNHVNIQGSAIVSILSVAVCAALYVVS